MTPTRTLILRTFAAASAWAVIALTPGHAAALVEDCDQGVSFAHGGATQGLTGTVNCVDRNSRRPHRTIALRDGLWHGPATWYNPDTGLPERVEEYRDGRREGLWRRYDREGRLVEENSWHNDRQLGVYRRFDPDGRLRVLGWATGGTGRGARLEYDEQGRLASLQCSDQSRLEADVLPCGFSGRSTVVLAPDRRGAQRSAQYLNGKLDGVTREIVDGKVVGERVYVAGELQEERQRFGEVLRVTMKRGREGSPVDRFTWFGSGGRHAHARFENGRVAVLEGWWQNGQRKLHAVMTGRDHAEVQTFYDTGAPNETYTGRLRRLERTLEAWFEPDGDYRSVTSNGKPLMTGRYERDRFAGESNEYDESGVLRSRAIAQADGSRRLLMFDERGRPASEQVFLADGSRQAVVLDARGATTAVQSFYPDGSRVH